jgi:hypothetical protein
MAKAENQWQREAAAVAARIDAARETGQLSLFEGDEGGGDGAGSAAGKRGKGKALSSLRDLLAARGLRMPEEVLANIAALDDPEGPVMAALKKAEAVALALYGHGSAPATVRLRLFEVFFAESRRALDALLPYGLAKITPDVQVQAVQIVQMPAPSAPRGGDVARDITPTPARFGPPPMPEPIEQNQRLGNSPLPASDASDRTE